jgi:hypothetical protein
MRRQSDASTSAGALRLSRVWTGWRRQPVNGMSDAAAQYVQWNALDILQIAALPV